MGYTTNFIGRIDIEPPLNRAEYDYLSAFAESRRFRRPGGPYAVPRNPAAERGDPVIDTDTYNSIADDQPSLWCGWRPSFDGAALVHDGIEKFYRATDWMTYLIDHFLAPHAYAQQSATDWFGGFTFDHRLDGIIAACRQDSRELYLIRVEQNLVHRETLVPPSVCEYPFGD